MPLNEHALRKPGFVEGVRLRLADGQDWEVPKPIYQLYPKFADDGSVTVASKLGFGDDVDFFLDLDSEPEGEEGVDYVRRQFEIMAKLLRLNYDLSGEALGRLLTMSRSDPESNSMWMAIDRFLLGQTPDGSQPPKPSADGSD